MFTLFYDPENKNALGCILTEGNDEEISRHEALGHAMLSLSSMPEEPLQELAVFDGQLTKRPFDIVAESKLLYTEYCAEHNNFVNGCFNRDWMADADRIYNQAKADKNMGNLSPEKEQIANELIGYIQQVYDWRESVGQYYQQIATLCYQAQTEEDLNAITWDYSSFLATKPNVTMPGDILPALARYRQTL